MPGAAGGRRDAGGRLVNGAQAFRTDSHLVREQQEGVGRELAERTAAPEASPRGGDRLAETDQAPDPGESSGKIDVLEERLWAEPTGSLVRYPGTEETLVPEERERQGQATHPGQSVKHWVGAVEAESEGAAGDAVGRECASDQPAGVGGQSRVGVEEREMAAMGALGAELQLETPACSRGVDPGHALPTSDIAYLRRLTECHDHELALPDRQSRGTGGLEQTRTFAPARYDHGQQLTRSH